MFLVHVTAIQNVLLISKVFFISQTRICKFGTKQIAREMNWPSWSFNKLYLINHNDETSLVIINIYR